MKVKPVTAGPEQLFREISPGTPFQIKWRGKLRDYLTTDLARAAPASDQPWDFRAAVDLESGAVVWLADTQVVAPTNAGAGPA
jgi:hypothetical protein